MQTPVQVQLSLSSARTVRNDVCLKKWELLHIATAVTRSLATRQLSPAPDSSPGAGLACMHSVPFTCHTCFTLQNFTLHCRLLLCEAAQ